MNDPRKQGPYVGHHFAMTKRDYDTAILAGRRFETVTGEPLPTIEAVRAALRADKEIISR